MSRIRPRADEKTSVLLCGRFRVYFFDLSGEFATTKLRADRITLVKLGGIFHEMPFGIEDERIAASQDRLGRECTKAAVKTFPAGPTAQDKCLRGPSHGCCQLIKLLLLRS